jgi:hypothetical protein
MSRTGYESVMWHLVKERQHDHMAAAALIGLWLFGWLALALTVFAPLD